MPLCGHLKLAPDCLTEPAMPFKAFLGLFIHWQLWLVTLNAAAAASAPAAAAACMDFFHNISELTIICCRRRRRLGWKKHEWTNDATVYGIQSRVLSERDFLLIEPINHSLPCVIVQKDRTPNSVFTVKCDRACATIFSSIQTSFLPSCKKVLIDAKMINHLGPAIFLLLKGPGNR